MRYRVEADRRETGRQQAEARRDEMIADGALSVKVEEVVIPTMRARAPEVSAAESLTEKLIAYWASRGETPSESRAAALINKANQLDTEAGS